MSTESINYCEFCNSLDHTSADHLAVAANNAQWGNVGAEIPGNFYQVYLKEGVIAKEITIKCDICEEPATDCSNKNVEHVKEEATEE